jgi:hypothetical protein
MANIGDVDDMGELVAFEAQRPPQHIRKHIGAHIADMRVIIDRRPATIDPCLARMDGRKLLQLAGQAVEQPQRHG